MLAEQDNAPAPEEERYVREEGKPEREPKEDVFAHNAEAEIVFADPAQHCIGS